MLALQHLCVMRNENYRDQFLRRGVVSSRHYASAIAMGTAGGPMLSSTANLGGIDFIDMVLLF